MNEYSVGLYIMIVPPYREVTPNPNPNGTTYGQEQPMHVPIAGGQKRVRLRGLFQIMQGGKQRRGTALESYPQAFEIVSHGYRRWNFLMERGGRIHIRRIIRIHPMPRAGVG